MGVTGAIHFSVGRHFPHDIIFFSLAYIVEKKNYNLHFFAAWNLGVTDMFTIQ